MISQSTISTNDAQSSGASPRRYFVGIGSNIRPKTNITHILAALLERVPRLHISPIVETASVEMLDNSDPFLNLTAAFESHLDSAELKTWFHQIEHKLGRDRSHPLSKKLPRPADIDELFFLDDNKQTVEWDELPPEPHIRPMLVHLLNFLEITQFEQPHEPVGLSLSLGSCAIGMKSTTVYATEVS